MEKKKARLLKDKGGSQGSQSHCMSRDTAKLAMEMKHDVC